MRTLFIVIAGSILFPSMVYATLNLDYIAEDVCVCLQEPHDQIKKAIELSQKANAAGNKEQVLLALADMMDGMTKSTPCFEDLLNQYPEIDDEQKSKVEEITGELCPSPASSREMNR